MSLPDITVEAAFGDTMLTATPTWTDISAYVRDASTKRGRQSVDGRFRTGTAMLKLDNRDGRFDPENTTGPYYPDVNIGIPVRIRHTVGSTFPVFYGSARSWSPEYPKTQDSFLRLPLVDGFYTLNLEDLAGETYAEESTDTRIGNVLDDLGWPAGLRDLDAGVASVAATSFAQPETGGEQPALHHVLDVAESEAGALFMSADGNVTFKSRVANSGAVSAATFTDAEMSGLRVAYDDKFLWNVVRVEREDGAQVEIDSSLTDPRRVLTRDVMPMANDAEALNTAEWLAAVFGTQRLRIDRLTLKPLPGNTTLLATILGLELRDVVTVQHTPPGGDSLDQECAIEHITHQLTPGTWTTRLVVTPLSAAEASVFFVLDSSVLDGTDVLA